MSPEQHTEILRRIDAELERPPITVEEAVLEAVEKGRMSPEEANDCIQAYLHAFHKPAN